MYSFLQKGCIHFEPLFFYKRFTLCLCSAVVVVVVIKVGSSFVSIRCRYSDTVFFPFRKKCYCYILYYRCLTSTTCCWSIGFAVKRARLVTVLTRTIITYLGVSLAIPLDFKNFFFGGDSLYFFISSVDKCRKLFLGALRVDVLYFLLNNKDKCRKLFIKQYRQIPYTFYKALSINVENFFFSNTGRYLVLFIKQYR